MQRKTLTPFRVCSIRSFEVLSQKLLTGGVWEHRGSFFLQVSGHLRRHILEKPAIEGNLSGSALKTKRTAWRSSFNKYTHTGPLRASWMSVVVLSVTLPSAHNRLTPSLGVLMLIFDFRCSTGLSPPSQSSRDDRRWHRDTQSSGSKLPATDMTGSLQVDRQLLLQLWNAQN